MGFIAVTDVVCDILGKLKLNHVKLGIRITGEHAGARRSVHRFFHALRTLAVMMAVDGAAPGLRANLVELVTERAHFGGVVLIARDNFVNGIDDDSVKVLIPYTADEFRNKLVERYGVTSEVPHHDAVRIFDGQTECLVDFEKSVDRACRINLKVHIEDSAFFALKAEPRLALRDSDAQFHEKKGLPGFG